MFGAELEITSAECQCLVSILKALYSIMCAPVMGGGQGGAGVRGERGREAGGEGREVGREGEGSGERGGGKWGERGRGERGGGKQGERGREAGIRGGGKRGERGREAGIGYPLSTPTVMMAYCLIGIYNTHCSV